MKLISATIALLASVTIVSSHPLYNSSYTTSNSEYESSPTDSPNQYNEHESTPTTTTTDLPPSETYDSNCAGFKITSQTESDITYTEYSNQEVLFDFTGSKIQLVEYVDLVRYEDKAVADEWATGPYYPSNPRTGLHEVHLHNADSGYYQFLVVAATIEDYHCKYYSGKFMITSRDSEPDHHDDSYSTYVVQLQAENTATSEYHSSEPSTLTYTTTTTSTSYSPDATTTTRDTASLVSTFDSILVTLRNLESDGDSNWKSHIQLIENDFIKIKSDIQTGVISGPIWIQDVEKLERDLDTIKTTGTGKWTDHISSLELLLDQLKISAWGDSFNNIVKAWETGAANPNSDDQELAALIKELESGGSTLTTSHTSTDYPAPTNTAINQYENNFNSHNNSSSSYEPESSSSSYDPESTSEPYEPEYPY